MNIASEIEKKPLTHLDNFSAVMGKKGEQVLAHLPDFKVSERHAHLMARKVIDGLRKSDQKAKQKLKAGISEMCSRKMGRKAYNHIQKMMMTQLGAVHLGKPNRKESFVYFLEVGEEGNDTVYLCSSYCARKNPEETWGSVRRVALTKHALERAFLRGCIWAKGHAVKLAHIMKELFDVLISMMSYEAQFKQQCNRLLEQGWNINFSDTQTQYIVRQEEGMPVVMTVFKAEAEVPEGGIAKMIPPQGSYENPKLLANLTQLGEQSGFASSA